MKERFSDSYKTLLLSIPHLNSFKLHFLLSKLKLQLTWIAD